MSDLSLLPPAGEQSDDATLSFSAEKAIETLLGILESCDLEPDTRMRIDECVRQMQEDHAHGSGKRRS